MSLIFGDADTAIDPSEKSPWGLVDVAGRWWLQREVIALERQISAGEGLVHQFCKRRIERLGPFEGFDAAAAYQAAMEGR